MSHHKEMSKRQMRRQQIRRKETRGRLIWTGLITLVAFLIAFLFIWPNVKPVAEVIVPQPNSYPQADGLGLGDPNAPVTIDVFEDFQCPSCRRFTLEVEPLIIENLVATGKVHYVFHTYPFLDGPGAGNGGESDQAANAGMCAVEQDKFWEMNAIIFANWNGENQGAFEDRRLKAFAEKIGLDTDQFNSCFDANKYKADIQADFEAGEELGVTGTPSVFVNNVIVNPGFIPSYDEIVAAVEAAAAGN